MDCCKIHKKINQNIMKKILILCVVVISLMTSCKKALTVKVDNASIGIASEVLVIMDKNDWPQDIQDSVRKLLSIPQPCLNQAEPMFDVLLLDEQFFQADKQRHYNIVRFVKNQNDSAICDISKGLYANPQVYVEISGNDVYECLQAFVDRQEEIRAELYENDIRKIQAAYETILNVELQRRIKDKFGVLLTVPKDYSVAREGEDFLWIAYRTAVNDRFVMIYRSDSTIITKESMINDRNTFCRKFIEGEKDNVHPIVTRLADLPDARPMMLGNKIGMEMRGIWETENDFMGGPFYHFSYVDAQNKCISVDGFVYAPNEPKRNYLRQVEAIVKSVK